MLEVNFIGSMNLDYGFGDDVDINLEFIYLHDRCFVKLATMHLFVSVIGRVSCIFGVSPRMYPVSKTKNAG